MRFSHFFAKTCHKLCKNCSFIDKPFLSSGKLLYITKTAYGGSGLTTMGKYVIKRVLFAIMVFFIIMTMIFTLFKLLPNPVPEAPGGYAQALRDMHEAWGYNKPIIIQYFIFLKNVFTKWDWGFCTTVGTFLTPVTSYITSKLPATVYVNVISVLISLPLGIMFGIIAAVYKNRWQDHIIQVVIMFFISVPSFVYAFLLQYLIGFKLNLLPLVFKGGNVLKYHLCASSDHNAENAVCPRKHNNSGIRFIIPRPSRLNIIAIIPSAKNAASI